MMIRMSRTLDPYSRSYYTSVKHRMRLGSRLIYLYLHQTTNNNEKEGKEDVLRTNWLHMDNDIWHHLTLVVYMKKLKNGFGKIKALEESH